MNKVEEKKKELPLISIITVCFNAEDDIEKTLLSSLHQTYTNIEIIVKDGRSEDGTIDIVKKIMTDYDRKIRLEISSDNGIYDAMNQAIDFSEGNWVIFMNAGDEFYSDSVLEDIFSKDIKADILYGDALVYDRWGSALWCGDERLIRKKMPFCHQACLISRRVLAKYKFDLYYKIAADYNLILTLFAEGYKFYNVNLIVAKYSLDGVSSTKYLAAFEERSNIRIAHKCVLLNYKSSIEYRKGKMMALIKEQLDEKCPKTFLRILREVYKKYFKKYKIIK